MRWASQALSPVTLMITLLLSSLKSDAKVQLLIDIDKEKGIYLAKIRFLAILSLNENGPAYYRRAVSESFSMYR